MFILYQKLLSRIIFTPRLTSSGTGWSLRNIYFWNGNIFFPFYADIFLPYITHNTCIELDYMSITSGVSYETGTAYLSREPGFPHVFGVVRVVRLFSFLYCSCFVRHCSVSYDHCWLCLSVFYSWLLLRVSLTLICKGLCIRCDFMQ